MTIHILTLTVAAQIAAGEVVERPASVVKELVENALDAGARRISVEARGGGVREIKVQDDGCGIPASEVELAFERHATSKLRQADDLWRIGTLGFRGEALPSVASVAQVICVTRASSEELGVELRIAGGEIQARTPRGCSPGTAIVVRNLFYNTPVRRDYLRSDATELSAISAVVQQYALAYPEVHFTLLLDGRLGLQTSGDGELRTVLIELYGLEVARQLLPVEAAYGEGEEAVRVSGLVSPPGLTRGSRGYLHLFVNRRVLQPRGALSAVIEDAYHTLLMKGRHPLAALNIDVHPAMVDVNVHPTKSEVKFRSPSRVHSVLGRAVRAALTEGAGVQAWAEPSPLIDGVQRRFELRQIGQSRETAQTTPTAWGVGVGAWDAQHSRWDVGGAQTTPPRDQERAVGDGTTPEAAASAETAPASKSSALPPLRVVGQVGLTYIIAESPEGMYLIDQHAAHERITYERLMAQRGGGALESQHLLMPQTVALPPAAAVTLLRNAEALTEWGFGIDEWGEGTVRLRAAPSEIALDDAPKLLLEMVDHLEGRGGSNPHDWREAILTTLACHSSVRAGQTLSFEEMRELLRQLEQCVNPRTCPHGRPTMVLITPGQLERQFGRQA